MHPKNPLLTQCIDGADLVRRAALALGIPSVAGKNLVAAADRFWASCEEWSENRGVAATTIAFIGPTKAGKTTLLSLLVQYDVTAQKLPSGIDLGTEKVIWVGPDVPATPDPAVEEIVQCSSDHLAEISGLNYTLIDVPGEDDDSMLRQAAATKALNWARIKILVLTPREIREEGYRKHLSQCRGATIVPVINEAPPEGISAVLQSTFVEAIKCAIGTEAVLPPLILDDYGHRGYAKSQAEWEVDAKRAIAGAIANAAPQVAAERELEAKLGAFRTEVRQFLEVHLRHSSRAFQDLRAAEKDLPMQLSAAFFEPEEGFKFGLRRKLRGRYLATTPRWALPWRPALGLANLVEGALDRAALAMMGSLPASIQVLFTAARNHASDLRFDRKLWSACCGRLRGAAVDHLRPLVQDLQLALDKDLHHEPKLAPKRQSRMDVKVEGLEGAIEQLKQAVDDKVNQAAPKTALRHALIGTGLFVSFFVWPIVALYGSYMAAWGTSDLGAYPSGVWSPLVVSFVLSLLPMAFWMIVSNAFLFRAGVVDVAYAELREVATHKESEIQDRMSVSLEQAEVTAFVALQRFADGKPQAGASAPPSPSGGAMVTDAKRTNVTRPKPGFLGRATNGGTPPNAEPVETEAT